MTDLDVNSENIDYLKEKPFLTKHSFNETTIATDILEVSEKKEKLKITPYLKIE